MADYVPVTYPTFLYFPGQPPVLVTSADQEASLSAMIPSGSANGVTITSGGSVTVGGAPVPPNVLPATLAQSVTKVPGSQAKWSRKPIVESTKR